MGLRGRMAAAAALFSLPLVVVSLLKTEGAHVTEKVLLLAVVLAVMFVAAAFAADRFIVRGMKRLIDVAKRIESGDLSARMTTEKGPPEVVGICDSFNRMAASVERAYGDLRLAESRLAASEAQYHSLFEDSPIAMWLLDLSEVKAYVDDVTSKVGDMGYLRSHPEIPRACYTKTRVLDVNRATVALFKAGGREYLLRSVENIFGDEPDDKCTDMLLAVAGGSPRQEFETVLSTLSGDAIETIVRWSVVPGHETTYGKVIFSVVDMTERKAAEREAQLRDRQLFQAAKMASLGTFVSGIVHELSNPNAYIGMNAASLGELLRQASPAIDGRRAGGEHAGLIPPDRLRGVALELTTGIKEGSDRIQRLIEELKRYARREDGAPVEAVDLNAVVASALTILKSQIASSTRRLSVRCAESLPPVLGRYQQLEQVVINIVANACQALEDRGQAITLATSWDPAGREIQLVVEDEGVGIAPELVQRLGDPFVTTRSAQGGIGLGLAVSCRIVEGHGGRIVFDSGTGRGTRVTMILPAGVGEGVPS